MNNENENINFHTQDEDAMLFNIIKRDAANQIIPKKHTPVISMTRKKYKRRFSIRILIIPLVSLFLAYSILTAYIERQLGEQMSFLAEASAEKYLYETVNKAVKEMADEGLLQYDNLVKARRSPEGEVIYLEVNTNLLSKAKAVLVERIQEKLEEKKRIPVFVPIGNLTGWNLASGIGFTIRVKIAPISVAEGEIYTVLEDCGINQTRHLIRVDIQAKLMLFLKGKSMEAKTKISLPLGERVLVGDVPEIYLDSIGAN